MEAFGEDLPFPDASFDIVVSQNAAQHGCSPEDIVAEMVRVLAPGGRLYFAVHVHHPVIAAVSRLYGVWSALGAPIDVPPFSDTHHLTCARIRSILARHPLRMLYEADGIDAARALARKLPLWHRDAVIKRLFFMNALYEFIAEKTA
jgi:SAM-dependent methyltransferase